MTSQYQSFPGAAGDSRTLDKLKALALPDLGGRSFLDVGCNEGFFCGFAQFLGATRVVGIDHGAAFVERARKRFPGCEFLRQGWEKLPDEKFDVILLASALHYADDQPALIARLVDSLKPGGVLVLELGIVSSREAQWVKVKRGIDERLFPTMPQLRETLADYAWKWMGPSINQDGDPVKRHVLHISRRLPVAYLLMQPPGYGKTSVANRLFPAAKVKLVTGDKVIGKIARGERKAPEALTALIKDDFSPFAMDRLMDRIFDAGLGHELVELWLRGVKGRDFALEGYIPATRHEEVVSLLEEAGYLPIRLEWNKPGGPLLSKKTLEECAESFYLSMAETPDDGRRYAPAGVVDEAALVDGVLQLRGWAITATGRLPRRLRVNAGGADIEIEGFGKQLRADVQAHLSLPHALFGWNAAVELPADASLAALRVSGVDDEGVVTPFGFSGSVSGS